MTQPESTPPPARNGGTSPYGPASPTGPASLSTPGQLAVSAPVLARTISFIIDFGGTVALTVGVVLAAVTEGFADYNGSSGGNSSLVLLGIAAIFVIPVTSIVLNVSLSHFRGHSVGQGVMRLRLQNVQTGAPASVGSIVGRMFILLVPGGAALSLVASIVRENTDLENPAFPGILPIFALVVLVLPLRSMLRGDGRGWQDRWTGQIVVPRASRA